MLLTVMLGCTMSSIESLCNEVNRSLESQEEEDEDNHTLFIVHDSQRLSEFECTWMRQRQLITLIFSVLRGMPSPAYTHHSIADFIHRFLMKHRTVSLLSAVSLMYAINCMSEYINSQVFSLPSISPSSTPQASISPSSAAHSSISPSCAPQSSITPSSIPQLLYSGSVSLLLSVAITAGYVAQRTDNTGATTTTTRQSCDNIPDLLHGKDSSSKVVGHDALACVCVEFAKQHASVYHSFLDQLQLLLAGDANRQTLDAGLSTLHNMQHDEELRQLGLSRAEQLKQLLQYFNEK